jgi:hypothetical protein
MLVASQIYLFVRGDRVLRLSRWSPRRKKLLRLALIGSFVSTLIIYFAFLSRWAPLEHPSPLILYLFIYYNRQLELRIAVLISVAASG